MIWVGMPYALGLSGQALNQGNLFRGIDNCFIIFFNVIKSVTLLSAAHKIGSEGRVSLSFYQKEQCGNVAHIFEESEKMRSPLFSLFCFRNFFLTLFFTLLY